MCVDLPVPVQYVANDLLPAMEALEVAMGHYTEWQEACAKFDTLDQVVYAYRFWRLCKGRDQRMASVDAASNQIEDCERQAAELEVIPWVAMSAACP